MRLDRQAFLGLAIAVPALCAEPAPIKPPAPPAVLLAESDLSGKTLQELWLMRNEIFARHGRPFKTYELYAYFKGKGYKLKKDYSEASLTPIERKNVALLERLEKELLKRNYVTENGREKIVLGNVLNRFQFPAFNEAQSGMLAANGFLVLPTKSKQLFHILEQNDYAGVPSLVTTDVILQVYHKFFDSSLSRLEQSQLCETLTRLCRHMVAESNALYGQAKDPTIKEAARRNMAYFSVPLYFLNGRDAMAGIPAEVQPVVLEEADRCEKHEGLASALIIKSNDNHQFDYSQFVPRGHYTRNEKLKAYFMAMMWFGTYGLPINDDIGLAQSLLIAYQLQNKKSGDKTLIELWRTVYEPTAFYAGLSDEIGPQHYLKELPQIFAGSGWDAFHDPTQLADMRRRLVKAAERLTRIDQQRALAPNSQEGLVLFKFMGQRYIPDSDIFTRLTNSARPMPKALDVMSVLGSDLAAKLMRDQYKDTWADWPEYPEAVKKARAIFSDSKGDWRQNLYHSWLWALKPLMASKLEAPYPFFMRSEAYPAKSLQTVLGSWTELRHDTILYSKQSYAAECGGGEDMRLAWIPDPPKGYVEPNAEFYGRLKDLLRQNREGLDRYGLMEPPMSALFERLADAVSFLEAVSAKELAGQPLSIQEYSQIRRFGGLLQSLTQSIGDVAGVDEKEETDDSEPERRRVALVADVHTRTVGNEVLEEAVGNAAEIYAVVELEGRLALTRGAAFTHYEFAQPLSQRLTDEQWQSMLDAGKAPPRDAWTDVFFNDTDVNQPKPVYIDEAVERHIGVESGWKTIDYDTGS